MNYKKIAEQIQDFIKNKTKGLNGTVIGLSGGIDSTVVAYLAVNALGKENVFGIIMPYNKNEHTDDGIELAKKLGINYEVIDIKPLVEAFEKTGHFSEQFPKANIMARIRMCLLYGLANEKKFLVLGTSNKSEVMTGYYTKYGDGGVDIEPIGDLFKTEVWELARFLGIDKKIIEKIPSADLWAGQKDEDELGVNYQILDKILCGDCEGVGKEKLDKVNSWRTKTQHKREMPPICEVKK